MIDCLSLVLLLVLDLLNRYLINFSGSTILSELNAIVIDIYFVDLVQPIASNPISSS